MNLTKKTHQFIAEHFSDKNIRIAIDATCGNGNDSLFLAKRADQLFCFDVQAAAIHNTQKRLQASNLEIPHAKVTYIEDSHSNMQKHCSTHQGIVDVVMFNLGFLPQSADLGITTQTSSTLTAIQYAMQFLADEGLISILCYRGHTGGAEEFQAINELLNSIDQQRWHWQQFDSFNANESTPILLLLTQQLAG